MKPPIPDFLEQCYELVECAKKTLFLVEVSYLVTWHKIFTAPRSKCWSDLLLVIWLLFTVPVPNAKLERTFSKLKRVKTNFHCSLRVKRLRNILEIMEEGSSWQTFVSISVIKKWNINKVRRTTGEKVPHRCKSRNSAKVNVESLSDDDSYHEEENISENRDEKGYLFFSDSEWNN